MTTGTEIEPARLDDVYQRLRARLQRWLGSKEGRAYRFADFLLVFPDFVHLMIRIALDRRVPMELRTQTAAVLAYVTLPIDLVPEGMLGPVGFADDLLLAALMTRRLLTMVPPEIVLSYWAGPESLIRTLRDVLEVAEEIVGSKVWRRLQKIVGGAQR